MTELNSLGANQHRLLILHIFEFSAYCHLSVRVSFGDPVTKSVSIGIPFTSLPPPYFCVCPNPGHGLPISYVVDVFVFNNLKGDVIFHSFPVVD